MDTENDWEVENLSLETIKSDDDSSYSYIGNLVWKSKDGKLTAVKNMTDQHLRNTALMLIGLGYQVYRVRDDIKIKWLIALRIEWERRMQRKNVKANSPDHY